MIPPFQILPKSYSWNLCSTDSNCKPQQRNSTGSTDSNSKEIYISTAREQKSLGTIVVRHDGYHVAYKVLVRHVVGHFRPASVALTFALLLQRYCNCYCFVTRKPFKPRRVCGMALVRGIRFKSLFWFFVSGCVTGYRVLEYSGCSCLPLVRGQRQPK